MVVREGRKGSYTMSDTSPISSRIYIRIQPSAEEDDEMETLSLVEDVRQDFLDEIVQHDAFTVEIANDQTRDGGLIVLIPEIVRGIISQKDLIMQFFQTSKVAIDALAKREHVQEIEMTVDGDTIRIVDANYAQADRLISIFEAKHPGKAQQITASSIVEITGTISRTEQPALPEKIITEEKE
jgi:hypothetical protein